MSDLLQHTQSALNVFEGNLVVGNHDSITLLGTQAQVRLRDYSRSVSKLFTKDNDELETAISDVVEEIEHFEIRISKKNRSIFRFVNKQKELKREYNNLVAYIERVCLFFQMQQAQLLKENKLLERLSETVNDSVVDLERCISTGEQILCSRPPTVNTGETRATPSLLDSFENEETWYTRLNRKIDDLRISHTAALQNQAQIKILYENNLVLLDRIASAISNTFPIWQSQMILMLGIERLEQRLDEQERVSRKASSYEQLDIERIAELNQKLKAILEETVSLEKKDSDIRNEFQEKVHYIERGKHYE